MSLEGAPATPASVRTGFRAVSPALTKSLTAGKPGQENLDPNKIPVLRNRVLQPLAFRTRDVRLGERAVLGLAEGVLWDALSDSQEGLEVGGSGDAQRKK